MKKLHLDGLCGGRRLQTAGSPCLLVLCESVYDDETGEILTMLGEKLIAAGIITEDQLNQALEEQKKTGDRIGDTLVKLGFATEDQIEAAFSS